MLEYNPPRCGRTYLLKHVFEMDLRDAPCLMVEVNRRMVPIQWSHITQDQLLSALADTAWKYILTTKEWVSVFHGVDYRKLKDKISVVRYLDELFKEQCYHVTLKEYPCAPTTLDSNCKLKYATIKEVLC